jgi:hypothetical protein
MRFVRHPGMDLNDNGRFRGARGYSCRRKNGSAKALAQGIIDLLMFMVGEAGKHPLPKAQRP